MAHHISLRLQRNQSRCIPEARQPSGFFLKRKPHSRLDARHAFSGSALTLPLCAVFLFALSAILLTPRSLCAQSFDATALREPTDLGMKWLVKAGDDPAYARADLDDSQWMRVDPNLSLRQYFPGRRPEVLWYRLHVKVAPNQRDLALSEWNLTSAFEIYANGNELFQAGQVMPYKPYLFNARLLEKIPDSAIATGSVVIAMRLHISTNDWISTFPGFYPYNLTIGQEKALSDHIWLTIIGQNTLQWFFQLTGLGLGFIALALYMAQRRQREYLWIFLLFLGAAVNVLLQFYLLLHNLPAWMAYVNACFQILGLIFLTQMYLAFLHMRMPRWLRVILALAAAGLLFGAMQTASGNGSSIGTLLSFVPMMSLDAGIIPVLLILHWRRGNREAGILLVPALVASLSIYLQLGIFLASMIPGLERASLDFSKAVFNWTVGPFTVNVGNLDNCLFVLTLAIILVLRSTRISHQQALLESEMAAAREVQQIILPEQIECIPGFSIESAYEPAQQVGGDFFQILSAPQDSLFLVIGDVAGKGLPAAMLVSVLVGAIRGSSEYTSDPAELLAHLNRRLMGHMAGGFSTALAARIFPDGSVVLANAGHLPPYLDGREVEVPGALPLGAKAGTQYETVRFQLPRGSRLTFYSDGIVEAKNSRGELLGFERGRQLSTQPAQKIVEAAKHFGQQDDMTVIAVTRDAPAAAARESSQAQESAMNHPLPLPVRTS